MADIGRRRPDVSLINLETAITNRGVPEPKGINYRMDSGNVGVLTAAGVQACTLANNDVLDWGIQGLLDTLSALKGARVAVVGAGRNTREAEKPLLLPTASNGRVVVLAFGCTDSGIPEPWKAGPNTPGICLVSDLGRGTIRRIADVIARIKRPGDVAVVSLHWGGNWGL